MPSDIAAGLTLLHQQQDSIRNSQEPDEVVSHSPGHPQVSPLCWLLILTLMPIYISSKNNKKPWPATISGVAGLDPELWLLLVVVCHLSGKASLHLEFRDREPIPSCLPSVVV